jgi:hypothetical protein
VLLLVAFRSAKRLAQSAVPGFKSPILAINYRRNRNRGGERRGRNHNAVVNKLRPPPFNATCDAKRARGCVLYLGYCLEAVDCVQVEKRIWQESCELFNGI